MLNAEQWLRAQACMLEMGMDCERATAAKRMREIASEVEGLKQFKASVDEALNSGNGSYKP